MRVFVTGASGFVGSAVVNELLNARHKVLGMVRSEKAAAQLKDSGADVFLGDIYQPEAVAAAAKDCDAVIHTAFNHDFSKYKENCETDRKLISAIGQALKNSSRPFVGTSGLGIMNYDHQLVESDKPASSEQVPRAASEEAILAVAENGVKGYIVRLPPTVHDAGDHGFIPMIIEISKQKKASAYVGDGKNRWPAVHRLDAAILYRLIIEQQHEQQVYHAVGEEGVAFKDIATSIGNHLQLPVISKTGEEVSAHFGFMGHFAGIDCYSSSARTRELTGWTPVHKELMEDLNSGVYFQ